MTRIVVAVDGPAGAGKGTLCRRLGEGFGLATLDTGMLYRAAAAKAAARGIHPVDEAVAEAAARDLTQRDLALEGLRSEAIGAMASRISALPAVRRALHRMQVRFAADPPSTTGAVLDGRDIGTVICPDADLKVWLDAAPEVRAARRHRDGHGEGTYERTLAAIEDRDRRERGRAVAPMVPAADAILIDTTAMSADEVFEMVAPLVRAALARKGRAHA